MPMTELFTLGKDAVVRQAGANNTSVVDLALGFNYGRQKDQATGRLPTQWVEGVLWGSRAESLAPYLLKGTKVVVTLEHVHIEPGRPKNDGSNTNWPPKMRGEVIAITLGGSPQRNDTAAPAPAPKPAPRPAPAPAPTGFADMDEEIPF